MARSRSPTARAVRSTAGSSWPMRSRQGGVAVAPSAPNEHTRRRCPSCASSEARSAAVAAARLDVTRPDEHFVAHSANRSTQQRAQCAETRGPEDRSQALAPERSLDKKSRGGPWCEISSGWLGSGPRCWRGGRPLKDRRGAHDYEHAGG